MILCPLLAASVVLSSVGAGHGFQHVSAAEARKVIQAGNVAWGKARVAYDNGTMDKFLSPDFYAQLPEKRLSRKEFLDITSTRQPKVDLTRFDATVLTVEEQGDKWVATILEKLEAKHKLKDGRAETIYLLALTKDSWKQLAPDKWTILSSEMVSEERWNGTLPPVPNW